MPELWNIIENSEVGPNFYYGDVALPENSRRFFGSTCCADGCEAHCLVGRPDGKLISLERAQRIAAQNGWAHMAVGRWVCPLHNLEIREGNS